MNICSTFFNTLDEKISSTYSQFPPGLPDYFLIRKPELNFEKTISNFIKIPIKHNKFLDQWSQKIFILPFIKVCFNLKCWKNL